MIDVSKKKEKVGAERERAGCKDSMATEDGGRKRKLGRDVCIYFLFNSGMSQKCAALFKLKITTTAGEEDNNQNEFIAADEKELKLVQTFFDKQSHMFSANAACAHLGSGKYLFMPNESDHMRPCQIPMQKPCVYDFVTTFTHTLDKSPLARKLHPVIASVGNKVYVLSRRSLPRVVLPEPSFEAYDPEKKEWETLIPPIFLQNTPLNDDSTRGWNSFGYAVFQEFIIMSFWRRRNSVFVSEYHSYNTLSAEWKLVQFTTKPLLVYPSEDDFMTNDDQANNLYIDKDFYWVGEALVVKNFIYAYSGRSQGLVSYNCAKTISEGCDILSFIDKVVVESFEFRPNWAKFNRNEITGAVGKIRDDLICMVQTIFSLVDIANFQPVQLTIFRILEGGRCCRLTSFELSMPGTELFRRATISSCFLLQPEVASNVENGEPTPKKRLLNKVADAVSGSEAVMMETSMA